MEVEVIYIETKSRNTNLIGTGTYVPYDALGLYFFLKEVDKYSLHISDRVNFNRRKKICQQLLCNYNSTPGIIGRKGK